MNKQPKEIDWSKAKPVTKGVMRNGAEVTFLAVRGKVAAFVSDTAFEFRNTDGSVYDKSETRNTGKECDFDILLPWESCIAEGHNPDKLTNEQVGDGYRLIQSYIELSDPRAEYYNHDKRIWSKREDQSPYICGGTYRVPIANPKRRAPCGPEHFPPGTVIRTRDRIHWQTILWARPSGLGAIGIDFVAKEIGYEELIKRVERSIDGGKTWIPCYVELKE